MTTSILEKPFEEFSISEELKMALNKLACKNLGELLKLYRINDLQDTFHFSYRQLKELYALLEQYGLQYELRED